MAVLGVLTLSLGVPLLRLLSHSLGVLVLALLLGVLGLACSIDSRSAC